MPHPIEAYAREAFAAGWASSGGPMTDRVKSACTAAVQVAVEHADDPQVLEVTIDLGRLEGLWAKLFARREKLIATHTSIIGGLWRRALTGGIIADAIRRLRQPDTPAPDRQDVIAAVAAALAALPSRPDWLLLRQAMRDALADGQAEGAASAAAVHADRLRHDQPDWDAEFTAALGTLAAQTALWSDTDDWLERMTARAAADLSRTLDSEDIDDSDDEDLAAAADQQADSAPGFTVDWAMTAAIGAGAIAWYSRQGVDLIAWIDAGDGRVCPTCDTNAANSPYPAPQFPQLPAHPGCRCIAASTT